MSKPSLFLSTFQKKFEEKKCFAFLALVDLKKILLSFLNSVMISMRLYDAFKMLPAYAL